MTWTYVGSSALFDRDDIRELVGDVNVADQLISDERIDKYRAGGSAAQPNRLLAAAMVCREISADLRRRANLSAGGTSVQLERQAVAYRELADEYRAEGMLAGVSPYLGGRSRADKDAALEDDDRVAPAFTRLMGDPAGTWPATAEDQDV